MAATRSFITALIRRAEGALTTRGAFLGVRGVTTSSDPQLQRSTAEQLVNQDIQVSEQQRRNEEAGQFTELVRDFLNPKEFYDSIRAHNMEFFCGVPDSLLKDFCAYVTEITPRSNHVITVNEGQAIALASGYHMATGKTAVVYLQANWEHLKNKSSCGIPFQVLPDYHEGAEQALYTARKHMETTKSPYCLLVRRQNFLPYKLQDEPEQYPLNREGVLQIIVDALHDKDVVVGTTGMLSRELFEYRVTKGQGHEKDFLTVGSMGHASAIALGIAKFRPRRQVFCLDGDGAALMHMGNMATIGHEQTKNLKHIIINNGCHDSVGGQPTVAGSDMFSFIDIAKASGYSVAMQASEPEDIAEKVKAMRSMDGPVLLEIKCNKGGRKDLGRPTRTPQQNKKDFMHFLAIDH
ncbi:hypothetical protein QZH41_010049 [Actinostola sp. cb2023]|nr:hypothetical protein QZH41_010049 [Actinostola sp. cb2023]